MTKVLTNFETLSSFLIISMNICWKVTLKSYEGKFGVGIHFIVFLYGVLRIPKL